MYGLPAKRQAKYVARQRARGFKQRTYWLTDEEHKVVRAFVDELTAARSAPEAEAELADEAAIPVQP